MNVVHGSMVLPHLGDSKLVPKMTHGMSKSFPVLEFLNNLWGLGTE